MGRRSGRHDDRSAEDEPRNGAVVVRRDRAAARWGLLEVLWRCRIPSSSAGTVASPPKHQPCVSLLSCEGVGLVRTVLTKSTSRAAGVREDATATSPAVPGRQGAR